MNGGGHMLAVTRRGQRTAFGSLCLLVGSGIELRSSGFQQVPVIPFTYEFYLFFALRQRLCCSPVAGSLDHPSGSAS